MDSGTRRAAVIMAGGSGERFWPLSRRLRPKQLLNLTNPDQSVLAEAVTRITPLIPPGDIFIATGEHLLEPIRTAQVGVPPENVLAEPCKRNTAGCLAYATAQLLARYAAPGQPPQSKELQRSLAMAVLTADHLIGEAPLFLDTIDTLLRVAGQGHALGVIGVAPTRPETGYGYIESKKNEPLTTGPGVQVYPVAAFHEKPDAERAHRFLQSGAHLWNAGMFFWNVADFMDELAFASPQFAEATLTMADAMIAGDDERVRSVFAALPDISIDYALMERARHVVVARAEFTWDDIGSWPALERTYPADANGNVTAGDPILINSRDCIVYRDAASAGKDVVVAVVGAQDLVVVVTEDAILVTPKSCSQDVKLAVTEIRRLGGTQI